MGLFSWIGDVFDTVGDIFDSVVDAVTSAVRAVVDFVSDHWKELLVAAALAVGIVYVYNPTFFTGITTNLKTFAGTIKEFAEIIHFDTIMSVHSLATLVSSDYRAFISEAMGEVASFSAALNLGASFIPLAIENSRKLVLDVSASLGRPYDLGQITWLEEFNGWAKKVAEVGQKYKDNPGAVLSDLDDWINIPYTNAKASAFRTFLNTVRDNVDKVTEQVERVDTIRQDFVKLALDMPEFIRKHYEPQIRRIDKSMADFIYRDYKPYTEMLARAYDTLDRDVEKHKTELSDIAQRLTRPGTLVDGINQLPPQEQHKEKVKLSRAVNYANSETASLIRVATENIEMSLKKTRDALNISPPQPAWVVEEVELPANKPIEQIDPRNTWFVGDY